MGDEIMVLLPNLSQTLQINDPEERHLLGNVTWEQYEALLTDFGDDPHYRITYLDGTLEIMSPGRKHEITTESIGRLLEAYLEENRIKFWGLGSTTFRRQDKGSGTEPDKSYCIGSEKELPDLAIEVVVTSGQTPSGFPVAHGGNPQDRAVSPRHLRAQGNADQESGGINKLTIYQYLGIPEVWFFQQNGFEVWQLQLGSYQRIFQSQLLPNLDLEQLAEYAIKPDHLDALIEYRQRIRSVL
jgi:Uma2 family endonuclease